MSMLLRILALTFFTSAGLATSGFLERSRTDGDQHNRRLHHQRQVPEFKAPSSMKQRARVDEVRKAIQHLWSGYKETAWGSDEVRPITGGAGEVMGEVGMFILDTLDTLWLAGLRKEFDEGQRWVAQLQLPKLEHSARFSLFEINIRALAGLLSAYALSGNDVFLEKARLFGDRLLQGFPKPGSNHTWPVENIDVHFTKDSEVVASDHKDRIYLANVGTNSLELAYLSRATGDNRYRSAANGVLNKLLTMSVDQGLAPMDLDPYAARFASKRVTVGPMGDSYFEYLLKRYLQGGCQQQDLLSTWKRAMEEMRKGLLKRNKATGLMWIPSNAKKAGPEAEQKGRLVATSTGMDHLSCYVGGMLALASQYVPADEVEDWWLPTGIEITQTCYEMYHSMPTGLAPDSVIFSKFGMSAADTSYRLRPETLESLFFLYRITRNETYREMSWSIFQAVNTITKAKYGFAEHPDVTDVSRIGSEDSDVTNQFTGLYEDPDGTVESYDSDITEEYPDGTGNWEPVNVLEDHEATWMGAETLKYALLTQMPPEALPLNDFQFNTEAHPLPVARGCVARS